MSPEAEQAAARERYKKFRDLVLGNSGSLTRPHFDPPTDWPTNRELIEGALRNWRGAEPSKVADGIIKALTANQRLISPTIERQP